MAFFLKRLPNATKHTIPNEMKPTTEQEDIIASRKSNLLVMAAAGSGKTATIREVIKRKIADGTDPRRILAITFTRAGAQELAERTDKRIRAMTIHAYAMRMLRKNPDDLIDEALETAIIREQAKDLKIRNFTLRDVRFAMEAPDASRGDAGVLARAVLAEIARTGLFSFSSVTANLATQIMNGTIPAPEYETMIVDEAQDTNASDALIYSLIAAENKIFVGDPRQAIFGFRGATPTMLMRMARKLPPESVKSLTGTFRCSEAVTKVANRLMTRQEPTESLTDIEGVATERVYTTEREETDAIMEGMREDQSLQQTSAILCRYNATAKSIRAELSRAGWRKEQVHVGTIHGAKGKEWDNVYLPATEAPRPLQDKAEENRILYVGLTRARHKVAVSRSRITTGINGGQESQEHPLINSIF